MNDLIVSLVNNVLPFLCLAYAATVLVFSVVFVFVLFVAIDVVHRRRELARSREDQPAAHQSRPPMRTAFPWKRLYIRSKLRRLRFERSSSESDSQMRCSCLRTQSAPSAITR